ncbi:MAG TPA: hypothetical protein VFI15_03625 [Candidatus Limnocylindrales bacterium]|nr:hypothetical protein [Candidatus Limnocylindrales bacterium]
MDEAAVRDSAAQFGDALVAGNVDAAIEHLSEELKRNLGEVVALLPLPATEVEIASVERGSSALILQLHVVGETADDELQTRWKDRDGTPRIVEISHLSRTERAPAPAPEPGGEADNEASGPPETAAGPSAE